MPVLAFNQKPQQRPSLSKGHAFKLQAQARELLYNQKLVWFFAMTLALGALGQAQGFLSFGLSKGIHRASSSNA